MARHNVASQLADYRGIFGWDSPATEIELYIKDHPIPIRRMRPTEIYSSSQIDPRSQLETAFGGVFFGSSDLLQIAISGFVLTPTYPKSHASYPQFNTPFGNISYAEVISNFLAGEYSTTSAGALQRYDPDYYITPYGHRYTKPIVAIWECQHTVYQAKQTFNATLYLEA